MNMPSTHVNVVKWSDAIVNGPGKGADASEGKRKRDGGEQNAPPRSVGYVPGQQNAGPRVVKQREDRGRHRHNEDEDNPCTGHAVRFIVWDESCLAWKPERRYGPANQDSK